MILQELVRYYDRKAADAECEDIPRKGFGNELIDFELVLSNEGELVAINSLEFEVDEGKKKTKKRRNLIAPKIFSGKKGNGIKSNFLWEELGYIGGFHGENADDDMKRAQEKYYKLREVHHAVGDGIDDDGMRAVLKFLDNLTIGNREFFERFAKWSDIDGKKMTFRIDGERGYVFDRPNVKNGFELFLEQSDDAGKFVSRCLVTGEIAPIALLHEGVRGVSGCSNQPNVLIGYQESKTAFSSYGKDGMQGYNAHVSELAAFKYATAINYLRNSTPQHLQIADATTIFWAEKPHELESVFSIFLDPSMKKTGDDEKKSQDDAERAESIKKLLASYKGDGKYEPEIPDDVRFYILGLAPNAARISIRFWFANTIDVVKGKIAQHFDDIQLKKEFDHQLDYPGLLVLLKSTALQGDTRNISPLLGGMLMRAVVNGEKYPLNMLALLLGRIRADGDADYYRCSMIKGILNRNYKMGVQMSLDKNRKEPAYLLGRLFAVLEKAQQDAAGSSLNSTIKDRYFAAASATPAAVFPLLLRLAQHYISKAEYGFKSDQRIEEILQNVVEFPKHFALEDQGLFTIGYYHQKPTFWEKVEKPQTTTEEE